MKKQIYDIGSIDEFIEELEKHLDEKITVFMIGGGAMCLRGLKDSTFDIDFVVETKKEFDLLYKALERFDFKVLDTRLMKENIYNKAPAVFEKGESRIDVFIKSVAGKLDFSKKMIERAVLHKEFGKLKLMLASNTDVYILKNVAGRDKDVTDVQVLLQTGIRWSDVVDECESQSKTSVSWIFFIFESLCKVENKLNITIEGKQRVFRACRDNWDKKPDDFMVDIENKGRHLSGRYLRDVEDSLAFQN